MATRPLPALGLPWLSQEPTVLAVPLVPTGSHGYRCSLVPASRKVRSGRLRRSFVDGDVPRAVGGERLASPPRPPLSQPHPGLLGHVVELGRTGVPERRGEPLGSVRPSIARRTSRRCSAGWSRLHSTRTLSLSSTWLHDTQPSAPCSGKRGTKTSTTKACPGSRWAATLAKARTCSSREPSMNSVLNTAKASEEVPGGFASAKSPMVMPMSSPPGFALSASTMAGEISIPCTSTPRRAAAGRRGRSRCRAPGPAPTG